jgi:hypothetical protein
MIRIGVMAIAAADWFDEHCSTHVDRQTFNVQTLSGPLCNLAEASDGSNNQMLPWAAKVFAQAWRRKLLRRRLLRFIRLRRTVRHLALCPYWHAWQRHTAASGLGRVARMRRTFTAWREYCTLLDALHTSTVTWAERTVATMGGFSLTWRLCKTDGPEDGTLVTESCTFIACWSGTPL